MSDALAPFLANETILGRGPCLGTMTRPDLMVPRPSDLVDRDFTGCARTNCGSPTLRAFEQAPGAAHFAPARALRRGGGTGRARWRPCGG